MLKLKVSKLQLGRQSSHAPVQLWNCSLMGLYRVAQEREILNYLAPESLKLHMVNICEPRHVDW